MKLPFSVLPIDGMPMMALVLGVLLMCSANAVTVLAQEVSGTRPLLLGGAADLRGILPPDTRLLIEISSIERFLDELEGTPPDWTTVYGHGHHDPNHDERLFTLNRERDARREGKPALQQPVAFVWPGELSRYDPVTGGFSVAIGPKFNPTRWGMVRFKPEDLPGNLLAIPDAPTRAAVLQKLEKKQPVDITVVMTGRLIPEESIVYDFSHDEEGLGLIMPVVRIERIDCLLER